MLHTGNFMRADVYTDYSDLVICLMYTYNYKDLFVHLASTICFRHLKLARLTSVHVVVILQCRTAFKSSLVLVCIF